MLYGKRGNILKCRNISGIISLFLLMLQFPASSCSFFTDKYCLNVLKHNTDLILEEEEILFIYPHKNTTTLFLTSPCDFSLKLNFTKEELISDHVEDVDGMLWGGLDYLLDKGAIKITLIKDPTLYYVEDLPCIARHNIRVTFDASSPADVAFFTTCVGGSIDNTNGFGSRDYATKKNYTNYNYVPTPTTSTTRIPMLLITLIVFGVIGVLTFSCHLCTLRWRNTRSNSAAPKSNWSAPATLPYNRFYNDDGLVPNASDRVPLSPSGPVPNFNTPPPPYPSDTVPPYSTNPSSTYGFSSPNAYEFNIAYIYDSNRV